MDISTVLLFIVLAGFTAFAGFLYGKYTDIYWRIKMMRQWQKKDWHLVEIVSKDNRTKRHHMFLPDQSIIFHGVKMWTVEKDKIYRVEKASDGRYRKVGEGTQFKPTDLEWKEGIPVLVVDDETFRPLGYDFKDNTNASPSESGALIKAYVANQEAKARILAAQDKEKLQKTITIVLVLALLCLVGVGIVYFGMNDIKTQMVGQAAQVKELHDLIIPQTLNTTATGGT